MKKILLYSGGVDERGHEKQELLKVYEQLNSKYN